MDLNFWRKDNSDSSEGTEESEVEYNNIEPEGLAPVIDYQVEPADPEKAKVYNKISRWAIYVGVFLAPLFFLPWTSSVLELNKQMLLVIVAGVAMVSWLLGVVSSGYLAWRNNYLDRGILALLGAFVVGGIFSIANFKSIFGLTPSFSNSLVSIISLSIIYFLVVNNIEDRGKILRSVLGFAIVVALVYGLLQLFGVYVFRFPFAVSRAFNSVGSINVLGVIAAVSLPLFSKSRISLRWLDKAYLEKVGLGAALFLLVILNWWVLWSIAIAGMVAMIVFENLGGGRFRMRKLILPMTVVVLGVFLMVVNLNLTAFKDKLPVEVAPSFKLSSNVVVSAIKSNLAFGYGSENFSVAFDKYGASSLSGTTLSDVKFYDATSEVMTLLVQGGLVMVAALGFFFWCLAVVFLRFRKYVLESDDPESVKQDIGVLASLAALAVALFLYPFNLTLMTFLYLLLGLVVLIIFNKGKKEFNIEQKTSLSLASSLGFIGGLILVLVGVYFGATIYISDVKYASALSESDNAEKAALLVEAINWNGKDDRYYRTASQTALDLIADELKKPASADRNTKIQNYISTSISLARRATEITPQESLNWNNLGVIYQTLLPFVDGVVTLSEDAYLKSAALRPGDPNPYYRAGILYLGEINLLTQLVSARRITTSQANSIALAAIARSEENLKKSVELSPNFGLAIYNLGIVYERQGKIREAIGELEKVVPANSNQPGLAFELGLLYYRAGRKDDAFAALERAVVLAPDYSNARWYLALIQEERGNVEAAIEQLERILSLAINKDNPIVTDKLTELRAGITEKPPIDILDREPLP
ncbi:MAG: hypothetical protein A3B91_04835 [Candidatus Yanofskybacteria bacterium RIFCSPHIGHO2_02_FULL_41_29]|uniref:Uncharacterized protein n=1 Tax=Candidatus Yanofskybacteria bacterium RIFCSPHIGHO2_01_FULL_41_53 TaxID=1802663 RepID=A0A1F8ELX4_9BACT|nr:MAG: hypothetical protein A2650_04875 [Candidatus Yanofskybacteria bacterium RIFCSPHIGHO2_01_FULL_41_53]OGN12528.1 MAG: hypothetical protein A3B91_04835 [Candidatus Yanofskybacteria bacterium RIFCSPHIGHO2_02_FULL_41_29]OGN24832.1 MAG: hypothetical protein A2916_04415 [Candidatus Yanofskybacteria bacterium RIFCSPLOWO2_01_FULL_41_67]OGN29010.1 MAG: hypothetical protein A3H54_03365 [Candidatus Yanofskybacteria bacterium RIFCSPLOWO2_02_FULL_41_13]